MRSLHTCFSVILISLVGITARSQSGDHSSEQTVSIPMNKERTQRVARRIREYLASKDILVALLSRRGKIIDYKKGISDVDRYDATGLAHTGFVLRTSFSGPEQYVTMNFVWVKSEADDKDKSQLRAWSLGQFFSGCGEKDAMIMVPERDLQIKLWNLLRNGMELVPTQVMIDGQEVTRYLIEGGLFEKFHNREYNLLSDYANDRTQNCNEHLIKTLVAAKYGLDSREELCRVVEEKYHPYLFRLGFFKKWFARNILGIHIRFNERKERGRVVYKVMTVESMVAYINRGFLGFEQVQVFREKKTGNTYELEDLKDDYVKRNIRTGRELKKQFYRPLTP